MGQACDPRFGKGSALASRVRPVAVPLQFGQQLTNYSHLRLMMQAQNNSSLMLNNFTTSIYFTGTFEQFQEAERWWDGVSLSNLQQMNLIWIAHIFEDLPSLADEVRKRWYCTIWEETTLPKCQHWPRHTSDPSPGQNAPLQINQENMKNQSRKSDSGLARNLPPLLKFGVGSWISYPA